MKRQDSLWRSIRSAVWSFLLFFGVVAFVVTCSFLVFGQSVTLAEEDVRRFAPLVFFNVLVLALLFSVSDVIRRKVTVERPVKEIQKGLEKLMRGDFKAKIHIPRPLSRGNRFQDIVRENYVEGKTGNEIFFAAMEQAQAEGIRPMLYTHPIGYYGHGAGPLIGLYGAQGFVAGIGERKLYADTCYALELNIQHRVPEWDNQDVAFYIEETITYTGGKTYFNDDYRKVMIKI